MLARIYSKTYLCFFTIRAIWGIDLKSEPPMTSQPTTTAIMLTSGLAPVTAAVVAADDTLTHTRLDCETVGKR